MRTRRFASARRLTVLTLAGCLCAVGRLPALGLSPRDLLRSVAHFSDAEWAAVERGEPVAKVLDTDAREVAVAGAIRIAGSRDQLISHSRDLEALKSSAAVLDASRFSTMPSAADLRRVTFDDHNLDLRNCRPGDCTVRLGAGEIARFHREVNWNSADWRSQSAGVWREVLANYASAYQRSGRTGLPDYVNKRDALSVASEVRLLLNEYAFVGSYSPELAAYLRDFGSNAPRGAQQMLYWTREDFGIRPVFRISHQVVYQVPGPQPSTWIATNQVYADHYLDAALTVTAALESGQPGREFYVISVSRARTRSLSGVLRRFIRSTVQGRSREAMLKILAATKAAIEKPQR